MLFIHDDPQVSGPVLDHIDHQGIHVVADIISVFFMQIGNRAVFPGIGGNRLVEFHVISSQYLLYGRGIGRRVFHERRNRGTIQEYYDQYHWKRRQEYHP